ENARRFCEMGSGNSSTCNPLDNSFNNWAGTQPDNAGCNCQVFGGCSDGEDCGELMTDGTWNDNPCGTAQGYICETP
ncbi:MAG TPA: hypothetical protein VFZ61_34015, partial [Polyangiales bacterium]